MRKAIKCNQPECEAKTHKGCKDSPLKRYSVKPIYTCRFHRGEQPTITTAAAVHNAPSDTARVHCLAPNCKDIIKKPLVGQSRLQCIKCGKFCHKGPTCSGMKRDELKHKQDNWTCFLCTANYDVDQHADLDETINESAKGMHTKSLPSLRILQWNADGLKSKSDELAIQLKSLDIDIAVIQETWLSSSDRTPVIPNYGAIREDRRANIKRGGLIFYIKKSLPYDAAGYITNLGHEISKIRVRLARNKWLSLTNLYIPPPHSIGQEIKFDPNLIPHSASSIICGDFNAHHPTWDNIQPEDKRGNQLFEWASANNLTVLNNSEVTRHNKATSNGSSPDVTLTGKTWRDKTTWAVDDTEIGGSDHLPIVITINTSTKHQPVLGSTPRWRSNGVNWAGYRQAVEKAVRATTPHANLAERAQAFNNAIIKAAKKHVGKTKPGKGKTAWMTPKVRSLVKKRNTLRKQIKTHRKEWLDTCKEVSKAKLEAKQEKWVDVVSSALEDTDERGIWKFIKSLNGTPDSNSPNTAMTIGGKKVISAKKKADAFVKHYASVSSLKFSRKERAVNRALKRLIRSKKSPRSVPLFTMEELKSAISKMRRRGAPGPDDIAPAFLKELGPIALEELLAICNQSLSSVECPQWWRNAIIIPLLKAAKPPSDLASYRPVSLTSCIAKILERMFAERLYHLAESNGWFSSLQAGFRRGRSCADQIIRLSQAIEDGFQQNPFHRSVMVLLDYSKAFDTVWRQRLLLSMANKGVPLDYVVWINSFLQNRQARVRLHGATSSNRTFRQGVPQGCVLSPLLFLFFIDNLADQLLTADPERARKLVFSLFADDVTILARHRSREEAAKEAQWAVDIVSKWSGRWKLELNASKSEVTFFSTLRKEANHIPSVNIDGVPIPFNPNPKLLGVTFDRELTFGPHVKRVSKEAVSKTKLLAAVGNSKWGWKKDNLTPLYYAYVRSKLDYSGPGWQPWLSKTNIKVLEATQNKALRTITGQLKGSPVEALRYETGVESYKTRIKRTTLRSVEQAKRLPPTHPRAVALAQAVTPRNARRSWARRGNHLSSKFIPPEGGNRAPIILHSKPPWEQMSRISIFPHLEGVSNKNDNPEVIRAAAITAISKWNSDLTIFTDGSAVDGCKQGGAAAVIHISDDPPRSETSLAKGAPFTSSFEEECTALELAVAWIQDNCNSSSRPLIITDSQSLCKALSGHDSAVSHLRQQLASCITSVGIQWVPGHCGIPGNEEADQAANTARTIDGPQRPTTLRGIIPVINRNIIDPPCRPEVKHVEDAYKNISRSKEKEIKTKWDQVYLARLRAGHHWDLRSYMHKIDNDVSPLCPRCKVDVDTTSHIFECPGTMAARQRIFGTVEVPVCALSTHPAESLALARSSLRGVECRQDGFAQ